MAEQPAEVWWAESIFGANTRRGLVKLTIGNDHQIITPNEARAFAHSILEAAEAAEMDEVLVRFLTETEGLELSDNAAVAMLREFREMRRKRGADA